MPVASYDQLKHVDAYLHRALKISHCGSYLGGVVNIS